MPTAKKKSHTMSEPQPLRSGDRLSLGSVKLQSLIFCHSLTCKGDHELTADLVVYIHWNPGEVAVEPVLEAAHIEEFPRAELDRAFHWGTLKQRLFDTCPLLQFFDLHFLPVTGAIVNENQRA